MQSPLIHFCSLQILNKILFSNSPLTHFTAYNLDWLPSAFRNKSPAGPDPSLPPPASLTQLPPNSATLVLPQLLKNFIPPHISGHWHMRFPPPGTFSHTPSHPCQMSVQKACPLKSLLRTFCKGHVLYKRFYSTVICLKQISHLHDYLLKSTSSVWL